MAKRTPGPYLPRLLAELAIEVGARVVLEPEWSFAGQIIFKNGRHSYFRGNALDLNSLGATEIAADKAYAEFFLRELGYPTVPGSKTFFSDAWAQAIHSKRTASAAVRYAQRLRFPVIVKPNSGSKGRGVTKVHTAVELERALSSIFSYDKIALVQQPVMGRDYRLVVLDGELISAYERLPLSVAGDGHHTVRQLLEQKQRVFRRAGRDTVIDFDDLRIHAKLRAQKLRFSSVPPHGERVFLLDNANLSTGGESLDMTGRVHAAFEKLAVEITRKMGLRLCGVDLIVAGSIEEPPGRWWVLEVNAAPGLDHYVTAGIAQEMIVRGLYRKVLHALAGATAPGQPTGTRAFATRVSL